MARYIDVDTIKLKGIAVLDENLDFLVSLSDVRKSLQMTPTADVVPKSEWISIDERLPEESAWYLVNIINHFGLDMVTFTHYTKGLGWGIPDVTHWMPLPEPPKMKGE